MSVHELYRLEAIQGSGLIHPILYAYNELRQPLDGMQLSGLGIQSSLYAFWDTQALFEALEPGKQHCEESRTYWERLNDLLHGDAS